MTISKHSVTARVYSARPEIVYSEGFETNTGGWTAGAGATSVTRVASPTRSGTGSLRVLSTVSFGPSAALRTVTGLEVGATYTLRAWAYLSGSPTKFDLRIGVTGIGRSPWAAIPTMDSWKQIVYVFTATATSHQLVLEKGTTYSNAASWDDVVLYKGGTESTYSELPVTQGRLEMDLGWSPYIQGSITVPLSDAVAALDPRQSPPPRIYITATQVFGVSDKASRLSTLYAGKTAAQMSATYSFTGNPASRVSELFYSGFNEELHESTSKDFNLTLRRKTVDYKEGTVTFEVTSDEALLQDYALVRIYPWVLQSQNVRTITSMVLDHLGFSLSAGTANGVIEDVSASWEPGQTAWDFLAPLVQQAGLRLWSDQHRLWHLDVADAAPTGTVSLASDQTIVSADSDIARDGDWYDAVVIKYVWDNVLGDQQVKYDVAYAVPKPTKVYTLTYEIAYPGPGAAAIVLKRKQMLGEIVPIDAVSSYDLEPGYTFTLDLAGQATRTGTIQSVQWSWPDDEMSITTKDLTTL